MVISFFSLVSVLSAFPFLSSCLYNRVVLDQDWMTDSEEGEHFEWDTSDDEDEISKGNNQGGSSAPPIFVSVPSREVSSVHLGLESRQIKVFGIFIFISDCWIKFFDFECETCFMFKSGEAGSSRSSLLLHFVGMGFTEDRVVEAIKDNGEGQPEVILETLLTYAVLI
ncbi:putative DNA (cytosine-5-)-methyltransferase [Dioscorea sansibarensis]